MAIAYRSSSLTDVGAPESSCAITVPNVVQAGDMCVIFYVIYNGNASATAATSGITTPALLDTFTHTNGNTFTLTLFQFIAATGDAGKTITLTPSVNTYDAAILLAYSGAQRLISSDWVHFNATNSTTYTSPTVTPASTGCWEVSFANTDSGPNATYSRGTARQVDYNVAFYAYDSNGVASYPIGGGLWDATPSSPTWAGYTIALRPASEPGLFIAGYI